MLVVAFELSWVSFWVVEIDSVAFRVVWVVTTLVVDCTACVDFSVVVVVVLIRRNGVSVTSANLFS